MAVEKLESVTFTLDVVNVTADADEANETAPCRQPQARQAHATNSSSSENPLKAPKEACVSATGNTYVCRGLRSTNAVRFG